MKRLLVKSTFLYAFVRLLGNGVTISFISKQESGSIVKTILSTMIITGLIIGIVPTQAFAQARYTIDGQNSLSLAWETGSCQSVTIALDPGDEIDIPLFSHGGFWFVFDPTQISVNNILVYDGYHGPAGIWENGLTSVTFVPPNAYLVDVFTDLSGFIYHNGYPIVIADIQFCCIAIGHSSASVGTIPQGETWYSVSESAEPPIKVWDPYIDQGVITLDQIYPSPDDDSDGMLDGTDNCPYVYNPNQDDSDADGLGNVCEPCPNDYDNDADADHVCGNIDSCPNAYNPFQNDTYPPQGNSIGDACDCEGNFDCDSDTDGTDAAAFKANFGRDGNKRPCTNSDPCNGDFTCDIDVDGTDAALFKSDFGRSGFKNPCPVCVSGGVEWCEYP